MTTATISQRRRVITVANLKGGVGKTTSAVYLAEEAERRGRKTLLVDADSQGSAMRWADTAADEGDGLRAVTVALPTPDLARRLDAIASGYDQVIIDTPPGDLRIVQAAVRMADLVVVPCQPTLLDLDRVQATLDVAIGAGRPAVVLLTRTRSGTRSLADIRGALDGADLPVLSTCIPLREAVAAAFGTSPNGASSGLYAAVLDEIEEALA
jgi:chromosome partitioning protein